MVISMRNKIVELDRLQIVGFIISIVVAAVMLVRGKDEINSVILGFVIAAFFQLFDLQKRNKEAAERVLQANVLSESLYEDDWLLERVQQIVEDYYCAREKKVGNRSYRMFQKRAEAAIDDCQYVLHEMAENRLVIEPFTPPFKFGETIASASKSVKHCIVTMNTDYWLSEYAQKGLKGHKKIVDSGVHFVRLYILSLEVLRKPENVRIIENQKEYGLDIRIIFREDFDREYGKLPDNFILVDDGFVCVIEHKEDKSLKRQRISIDPITVGARVKEFNLLLDYANEFDKVADRLKEDVD